MNDTRWLDEGEQRAWRSYLQMHGQLLARLNRQLQADSGLSLADYHDGRRAFIVLTDAGRRAIEAAAPGHVDAVRRLFLDGLTRDQITMLGRLSTQVLNRLDASTEAVT